MKQEKREDFSLWQKVTLVVLPLVSKWNLLLKTPKYKHFMANKVGGEGTELPLGRNPTPEVGRTLRA